MYIRLIFPLLIICCMISCNQSSESQLFSYGTKNDSARYYFQKGWEQIMDNGQWTLSEASFRKAATLDPDFLIGKTLVGRISSDAAERQSIYEEVTEMLQEANEEETLLLEIFLSNIRLMNARATGPITAESRANHRSLAETNFQKFSERYPEESYMKAEYIETLNANYGAEQALDSLVKLTSPEQRLLPFFIRYEASLHLALGNSVLAFQGAETLKKTMNNSLMPEPYVLYAEIYVELDSLNAASDYIEKALELDAGHLIAQGLKRQIQQQRSESN